MTVIEFLRGAREAAQLSQRALAGLAGVPQPSIAELESGTQRDATIGLIERLLAPCGAQLITIPTTTPCVAAAAVELWGLVRAGHRGLVFRRLIQLNDDLAREPPATRLALCLTPPRHTGDLGVDAFVAAVVEYRLQRLPIPAWTTEAERICDPPWDVAGIESLAQDVRRTTPKPFQRHGVLIAEDDLASI